MEIAERESRSYEREVKYQSEERERREAEDSEIKTWETHAEKQKHDWKKDTQERIKVQ
jgi:hypothetical protein